MKNITWMAAVVVSLSTLAAATSAEAACRTTRRHGSQGDLRTTECISVNARTSVSVSFLVTVTNEFTPNSWTSGGGFVDFISAVIADGINFQGLINGDFNRTSGTVRQTLSRNYSVSCGGDREATLSLNGSTARFIPARGAPGRLNVELSAPLSETGTCRPFGPPICTGPDCEQLR